MQTPQPNQQLSAMHHVCQSHFSSFMLTDLEEACENVELKHRDVVVAGEVDGGFESHGLQAWADGMHFVKALSEYFPRHYCPARERQVES